MSKTEVQIELSSYMASKPREMYVKQVAPKGDVLNDNGVDVDHLGHVVYAEALAQQIKRIKTPVSIGVFARWGTGKSFLLKHVQSILTQEQRQHKKNKKSESSLTNSMVLLTLIALGLLAVAITTFLHNNWNMIFGIVALFILLILLNLCFAKDECRMNSKNKPWYRFSKVISYGLFTQLPIRENESPRISTSVPTSYTLVQKKATESVSNERTSEQDSDLNDRKNRRFIHVNYNAWQYAGCDTLWAGIVTALAEKIEQEFGVYTTRVFRSLSLDLVERPLHFLKECCDFKSLLVELKKDEYYFPTTEEEVKENLNKQKVTCSSCKNLKDWDDFPKYDFNIPNCDRCWVISFEQSADAKEAYEKLQCCDDIKVYIFETADNSMEKKKIYQKSYRFLKHLRSYMRLGYILSMTGMILLIVTSTLLFTYTFIRNTNNNSSKPKSNMSQRTTIAEQVLVFLPAGVTVFFSAMKLIYALYNSHRSQVIKALQGAKKDLANELGFMEKIKIEVQSMTDLIHTVELSHNIEYKVIITIDDLDRVPLSKVKSVLEAVNILLSDRDSPFICLIAIDSRIANKCFILSEENKDAPPTVNGHEYLKKIINLPFCLPEMDNVAKPCYIAGLIDEADDTIQTYNLIATRKRTSNRNDPRSIGSAATRKKLSESMDAAPDLPKPPEIIPRLNLINFTQFLFDCRHLMYKDEELIKHLSGNPRNLKRIFNVISVTASLISSMQERENKCFFDHGLNEDGENNENEESKRLVKEILYWIVLTDQWPFRMSYILVVIEDADQRRDGKRSNQSLNDHLSLFDLYKHYVFDNEKEREIIESLDGLLCLDYDPDIFYNLLLSSKDFLRKKEAKKLRKFTINLDSNLMKSISWKRDKIDRDGNEVVDGSVKHEQPGCSSSEAFLSHGANNDAVDSAPGPQSLLSLENFQQKYKIKSESGRPVWEVLREMGN